MPGRTLGRYQLSERIGRGGMAEVFRADDLTLGRRVAVKVILPELGRDPQFAERFLREAKTVAALEHPHILPIYDYGQEGDTPYLVMPLLGGGSLAEQLDGRPLALARVVPWVDQLAGALDFAHRRGVTHRDLKPANILVTDGGDRLVLADFGIARLRDATTRLTQTGMVVGTPLYMAPEVAGGGKAGPAADLYALAVLAYEMLAGSPPFDGENLLSILHQHATRPVPPISEKVARLPRQVDGVLARGMAKDPEQRPATCRELAHALAAYLPTEQRPTEQRPTGLAPAAPTADGEALTQLATAVEPPGSAGDSSAVAPQDLVPTLPMETPSDLATPAQGSAALATTGTSSSTMIDGVERSWPRHLALVMTSAVLAAILVLVVLRIVGPARSPIVPAAATAIGEDAEEVAEESGSSARAETPAELADEPLPSSGPDAPPPTGDVPRVEPPHQDPRALAERNPVLALGLQSLELRTLGRRPEESDFLQIAAMAQRLEALEGQQASTLGAFAEGGLALLRDDGPTARERLATVLENPGFLRFWGPNALTVFAAEGRDASALESWQLALAYGDPARRAAAELEAQQAADPGLARRPQWRIARALVHRLDGESESVVDQAGAVLEHHAEQLPTEIGAYLALVLADAHAALGRTSAARRWYRQAVEPDTAFRTTLAMMAAEGLHRLGEVEQAETYLRSACEAGHRPACELLRRQSVGPRRPSRGARRRGAGDGG